MVTKERVKLLTTDNLKKKTLNHTVKIMKITYHVLQLNGYTKGTTLNITINNSAQLRA